LIEYTLHGIRPRELFALWLRHLVLCYLEPPGVVLNSRLIGADGTVHFAAVPHPERELAKLLDYYWQGLRFPLPFFVKSSHAYAVESLAGKDSYAGLKAAHKIWDEPAFRNGDFRGESENAYYRTVYRGLAGDPLDARFEEIALALLAPMLNAMGETS
jgi:exodeoxyribonuclease V gamma subunit